ncbi:hypothetical protein C9374_006646 [Naegleria lovaniensis]|uniref:Uncharacterized protein n=1 Tax=Naegleria lovaniensis TaxID=51637 RepID=A0AA88KM41_NAELO|nr:uncharacterized protein C9374_006646 [Naegleria lovaniensis]KAG2379529.1 hypothetical protein C9374_006646 [Naegleria lovaniensis]
MPSASSDRLMNESIHVSSIMTTTTDTDFETSTNEIKTTPSSENISSSCPSLNEYNSSMNETIDPSHHHQFTETPSSSLLEEQDPIIREISKYPPQQWKFCFLNACSQGDLIAFTELLHFLDTMRERWTLNNGQLLPSCESHDVVPSRFILNSSFYHVNVLDDRRVSALHKASAAGHIGIVRELLTRSDIHLSAVDATLATPMHFAAAAGHVLIVKLLFQRSKEMADARDQYGNTPLLLAMQNRKHETVRFLLSVLPTNSIRTKKTNSRTLLHIAASNFDLEGIKMLLLDREDLVRQQKRIRKGDLEDENDEPEEMDIVHDLIYRETIEDMCKSPSTCDTLIPTIIIEKDLKCQTCDTSSIIQKLSSHGKVLIQAKEENGCTPLMLAIKEYKTSHPHSSKNSYEKIACLNFLLHAESVMIQSSQEHSISNQAPSNTTTTTMMSMKNHSLTAFVDQSKRTSLHLAAQFDCVDFFRIVALTFDRDTFTEQLLMTRDANFQTPMHLACKHGSYGVMEIILSMCAPPVMSSRNLSKRQQSPCGDFHTTTANATCQEFNSYSSPPSPQRTLSPPSSPSFLISPMPSTSLVLSNGHLKNQQVSTFDHPALMVRDNKFKTPLYYAATNLARDKEVLVNMICEMLKSGLISPQSELSQEHSSNGVTTSSTMTTTAAKHSSSSSGASTAYDVLLNQTDFFDMHPQFKDWFLTKQHSPLSSSPSKYRQRFNSDDQASATTRLVRSGSGTVFKKLNLFQSSSIAEDVDLRPISPMKRMQSHK